MTSRLALTLAVLISAPALADDPDEFPVGATPDIVVSSPKNTASSDSLKNRSPVSSDKNTEAPRRMTFAALEVEVEVPVEEPDPRPENDLKAMQAPAQASFAVAVQAAMVTAEPEPTPMPPPPVAVAPVPEPEPEPVEMLFAPMVHEPEPVPVEYDDEVEVGVPVHVEDEVDHDQGQRAHKEHRFEQRTLFGTSKRSGRLGLYGGWTGVQTGFGSGSVGTSGWELGTVLGGRAVLGVAWYGTNDFTAVDNPARFNYGGIIGGWIFGTEKLIHPRIDMLVGSGVLRDDPTGERIGTAPVFVPRAGLELNVLRMVRVGASVGYRQVSAPSGARKDLSAVEGAITIRGGWL